MSLVHKAIVLSTLVLFTSCHNQDSPPQKKEQTAAEAKTLRLYLKSEPLSMDPGVGGNRLSQVVLRELFEGLMRLDSRGNPAFAVADSIDLSDDKLTYRFHLRPTFWSNGTPVTAHDFEYSWKRLLPPDAPTSSSYAFYCIKNARKVRFGEAHLDEVGIHAEDDYTLTVTLEHPAPYFLELTSNPLYSPVCKAVVTKNPSWNNKAGPDFVCNGPFTLSDWKHQSEIVLAKNHYYWDAPSVAAQKILFPIISDPQTVLSLFESGELDWAGDPFGSIPLEAIPHLKETSSLYSRQIGSINWLELNTKHPVLASTKVRRALAMAVNRQELVDHLLQGGERPALTVLPETLTRLEKPSFNDNDVVLARALFEEGLQDLNMSKDAVPVLTISHSSESRDRVIAEALQQQWQQTLGVKIQLSPADWNGHLKRVAAGDFEIAGLNWYTFFHDPIYNLEFLKYKTCSFNATNWEDPRYIALLDQSDKEADTIVRNQLLREAEEFLMSEMPVIPICYNTSLYVKNPKVTGEALSPIGMFEWKKVDIDSGLVLVNK